VSEPSIALGLDTQCQRGVLPFAGGGSVLIAG
jgi:hypothetical protein